MITRYAEAGSPTVSTCTLGGTNLTLVGSTGESGSTAVYLYERNDASTGTISVEFSGNVYACCNYIEWSDATQTALSGVYAGSTGTGTATQTETMSTGEDMVFLSCHHWGMTPSDTYFGASQTKLWNTLEGGGGFQTGAASIKTGSGSVTQTYTNNYPTENQAWAACCIPIAPSGPPPQYARPTADVTDAGWTGNDAGTSLYTYIDEVSASDTDYIQSAADPANDECVVGLGTLSTPAAGTRTLRYRYRTDNDGHPIDLTVGLYDSSTLIQENTHSGVASATWTAGSFTVTGTINNWNALRVRFKANKNP
jgi:hypothetical protein